MKIKVGFSTSSMFFSRIIRFCTRSRVSHCYIRIYDEFLKTDLILHVERTMGILRAVEFELENVPFVEYTIDDDRLDESIRYNLKHLGKKFDWWSWAGWFPLVRRWVKTKIKAPTHSFKKMICVDFVLRVLNDADMTHLPYDVMTPELLRQWFEAFYEKFGWTKEVFNEN